MDNIKLFYCDNNLSQYIDSMLFDSGTGIATMQYEKDNWKIEITLGIYGEVDVTYKGNRYRYPSDFPNELKELIKDNRWWDIYNPDDSTEPLIYVNNNNWFEYIYYIDNDEENIHYSDGFMYEQELSKDNVDSIKQQMIDICEYLLENK